MAFSALLNNSSSVKVFTTGWPHRLGLAARGLAGLVYADLLALAKGLCGFLGCPRLTGIPEPPAAPAEKTTEKSAAKLQSHHLTPVRTVPSKRVQTVNGRGGCGEKGTLLRCWQDCKLVQPPWRAGQGFLTKLKIELPYGLAIPRPGTHPDKTPTRKDTGIPTFIAATFTTAKTWKQSKWPSAEECMKKT